MKDPLEEFIRNNRQSFDDQEPSPRIWKAIERSLGFSGGSWKQPMFLWRAAAIFFMALSAWLLISPQLSKEGNATAMEEFSDAEAFYIQQISHKVDLIGQIGGSDGLNGFTRDFQQLEAMYHVLKEEMKARPSAKVRDALILNLLVQIDLLNQQLDRLEEQKEKSGERKERST